MKEAFKVREDIVISGATVLSQGDTVYPSSIYDKGAADRASSVFGEPHVSVSKAENGRVNLVQVPVSALNKILINDED